MSDKNRLSVAHPFAFHGTKNVTNESAQITGLNNVGWMHVYSDAALYLGASGVGSDGFPIGNGETSTIPSSNLAQYYVSGSGNLSFYGGYSKN
jgi:hypothetical protein